MNIYKVKMAKSFRKDLKRLEKSRYDLTKLAAVVNILAKGEDLPASYRAHFLSGSYKGYQECHIEPDWLLVYEKRKDILVLVLVRTGTHSELFKK